MKVRCCQRWLVTALLLFFVPAAAAGERLLGPSPADPRAAFEFGVARPLFAGDDGLTAGSGCYELSARLPVVSRFHLTVSIPWNAFTPDGGDGENGIGNLAIGIQSRCTDPEAAHPALFAAVSLPTADSEASFAHGLGVVTESPEYHRSVTDAVIGRAGVSGRSPRRPGVLYGAAVGPELLVPVGNRHGPAEFALHYRAAAGVLISELSFGAELVGLWHLTGERGAQDSGVALELAAHWLRGAVRPAAFYRIPLDDDMGTTLDGVVGFGLEVSPGAQP